MRVRVGCERAERSLVVNMVRVRKTAGTASGGQKRDAVLYAGGGEKPLRDEQATHSAVPRTRDAAVMWGHAGAHSASDPPGASLLLIVRRRPPIAAAHGCIETPTALFPTPTAGRLLVCWALYTAL